MIDETNIFSRFTEPTRSVYFANSELRNNHVQKHILERSEKWRLIEGFDTETIHAMEEKDSAAQDQLAARYESFLSQTLLSCCRNGTDHQHIFYIYPQRVTDLLGTNDREPVQHVKCYLFSEKLVIIAASYVSNDSFLPYILKTGFRTFTQKSKKAWLKEQKNRADDNAAMYGGKKVFLVADHSGKQES